MSNSFLYINFLRICFPKANGLFDSDTDIVPKNPPIFIKFNLATFAKSTTFTLLFYYSILGCKTEMRVTMLFHFILKMLCLIGISQCQYLLLEKTKRDTIVSSEHVAFPK